MQILANLDTRTLVDQLHSHEATLTKLMDEEQKFKANNRGFMAAWNEDCSEVKTKLAQLWADVPAIKGDGGKATQADKEAWLRSQRTENKELAGMISKQGQVLAGLEGFRIDIDSVKRKIEAILAVIRLKTAQIEFLGRSI